MKTYLQIGKQARTHSERALRVFILLGAAFETGVEDSLALVGGARLQRRKRLLVVATSGAQSLHHRSLGVDGLPLPRHQLPFVEVHPREGAQAVEGARLHLQIADGAEHKATLVEVGGQRQHRAAPVAKVHLFAGVDDVAGEAGVHWSV